MGRREKGKLPEPKGKRESSPGPPKTKKGKAPRLTQAKREKGKGKPTHILIKFTRQPFTHERNETISWLSTPNLRSHFEWKCVTCMGANTHTHCIQYHQTISVTTLNKAWKAKAIRWLLCMKSVSQFNRNASTLGRSRFSSDECMALR